MTAAEAAAGSYALNGYNFPVFNVNYLQLFYDGNPVRSRPFRPSNNCHIEAYESLYRGLNNMDGDRGTIIKRDDWNRGYALFAFDLTPDMDADDHYALIKQGNLRLEVEFSEPLPMSINVIVYAEYDSVIELTADRNIQFDYV